MTQSESTDPSPSSGQEPTTKPVSVDPATFTEGHLIRVKRLERELASARKWSLKSTRQLHAGMLKDLRAAERRARQAERRADAAEQRLHAAEAEVVAVRQSSTWKAGRAVVAVPAQIKRWRRG